MNKVDYNLPIKTIRKYVQSVRKRLQAACIQEAQLPQRNSASATHVFIGRLIVQLYP